MPTIQTYDQQVLPQGQFNVQATPEQMGAGIGRAISDLGDTFTKIDQDKGEVWAYKTSGEAYVDLKKKYDEDVNKLDPTDPEFNAKVNNATQNFMSQIDQTVAKYKEQAPNTYGANAFERYMVANKRSLAEQAIARQANLSADFLKAQVDDANRLDMSRIAEDPSDRNFELVRATGEEAIKKLNLPPELKLKWIGERNRQLALIQLDTTARNQPEYLLKSINRDGGKIVTPDNLPADLKADTVKAYKAKEIEAIVKAVAAPSKYDETFKEAARLYNMDWRELKMRAVAESALNPTAVSSQNAGGIMQFTPETAADLGVDRNDPVASIRAAAKLLSRYGTKAGGDMTAVDKMYYGGEKGTAWGPNTKQYAANLAAVRIAMGLGTPRNILPQVQMLPDETIAAASPQIAGAKYLTPMDINTGARTAEGRLSQKLSLEQAELSDTVKDVLSVLGDGKEFPNINDGRFSQANLVRVFGPNKGKETYDAIEKFKSVSPLIASMSKMPNNQVEQMLAQYEPKEGPGYAADREFYMSLRDSVEKMKDARKKDYMGWALGQEGMNVKPIEFGGEKLRETLVARIPAAIMARQAHGIKAPMLSQDEASGLADIISRQTAADAVGTIKEIRKALRDKDDLYTGLMSQLAPKIPNFSVAGMIAIKQGEVDTGSGVLSAEAVAEKIVAGSFILRGNSADPSGKSPSPVKINAEKIADAFYSKMDKNSFHPNAEIAGRMASITLGAVQSFVAARIMEDGGKEREDYSGYVGEAIKAVTGGTVQMNWLGNRNTVFLPWGMSQNTFLERFPVAFKDAIAKTPLPDNMKDLAVNPANFSYANTGRDGEYIIVDPKTRRVVVSPKTGTTISVRVSHSNKLPDYFSKLGLPGTVDGR